MRGFLAISLSIVLFGMFTHKAAARDRDLGKLSADSVKSYCDKAGGKYWANPEGTNWGCATDCGGKTCGIMCDKDTGCLGSTPRARTRLRATERNLMGILKYSPGKQPRPSKP
jgi:hypothetical protein